LTAGELASILARLPPSTPVLTSGYEGGFSAVGVTVLEVQELDRHGEQEYLGQYDIVDEARRQAALSPDDPEIAVGSIPPPTLVGEPFHAAVLYREGR
jgi:hypothetical protein